MNRVILGDNMQCLSKIADNSVDLIYIDPPFNTGKKRKLKSIECTRVEGGNRVGFGGHEYEDTIVSSMEYGDSFDDFESFILPRMKEAWRVLTKTGSLYFHIGQNESHYCKVMLDKICGRENFLNEIIWAYDYGARSKTRWPAKHDTIFVYVKDKENYTFNYEEIDRIPYMAPGLVGEEKAAKGKTLTDVWWHTIVPTNGKEKTGYPTQKPLGILRRIIKVSSKPGDLVLDFFAGSGTTGMAASENGRKFIMIDSNKEAFEVMKTRFATISDIEFIEVAIEGALI